MPRSKSNGNSGKRIRTGIYRDGGTTLFVPIEAMHDARKLFPKAPNATTGLHAGIVSVQAVERGIGLTRVVGGWLKLYADVPWFEVWLKGGKAPEDVHVLSNAALKHAKAAWKWATDKHRASQYERFFVGKKRLPIEAVEPFMLWLYGGAEPDGWLILPEPAGPLVGDQRQDRHSR